MLLCDVCVVQRQAPCDPAGTFYRCHSSLLLSSLPLFCSPSLQTLQLIGSYGWGHSGSCEGNVAAINFTAPWSRSRCVPARLSSGTGCPSAVRSNPLARRLSACCTLLQIITHCSLRRDRKGLSVLMTLVKHRTSGLFYGRPLHQS